MFEHFSGRAQIHSQILFGKASLRLRIDALVPCRFICHKSLLSVTRLASTGSPQSPRWLANFANSFSLLSCARNRSRRARRMNFRLVSRFVSAAESGFLNRFFGNGKRLQESVEAKNFSKVDALSRPNLWQNLSRIFRIKKDTEDKAESEQSEAFVAFVCISCI